MTFSKSTFAQRAFTYTVRRSLPVALTVSGSLIFTLVPTYAHSHHHSHSAANSQASNAAHSARVQQIAAQDKALHSGNVVTAAYSLRGTRYVMGGTSRSGFDCSGFVRYILNTAGGVEIPRTATEQYYHGTSVSREQLQPGDLVFFKNTYKHGISHVGIYAGDGKFIHAANAHKGVREDNLNESYYINHYAGARRVLRTQMRGMIANG